MDNAMKMIGDIVSSLTKILVAVIGLGVVAVSYTHLTLPTICSV